MQIFRALTHPNFRLHAIGQSISLLGTWMQRIAISWLVYQLTDSVFWLGFVQFISLLPSLILSPFIGSFVDKHKKYKLLVITQLGLMIQAGILTLCVYFHFETIFILSLLGLIQGIINAYDVLARQSIMIHLVDDKKDLPNAIALNSTIFNGARMLGPAIAGILLSTYGELFCFFINFISFIPVLWTLKLMRVNEDVRKLSKSSGLKGLVEGFQYLKRSPHMSTLIIVLFFSSLFVIPYTSQLPSIAKEMFHGDATTFSYFESAAGLGAMLGAVNMARLKNGVNLRYQVLFAATMMGVSLLLLGHSSYLPLALIYTVVISFGMMTQNSSINTYLQTHAMPVYRARAISYYIMAFQGIFPVGTLVMGVLASYLGLRETLYLMGAIGVLIALSYYIYLRRHIHRKLFNLKDF